MDNILCSSIVFLLLINFFNNAEQVYDVLTEEDDKEYSIQETVGFRIFQQMRNPQYREYENGFPPGIYGSSIIPTTIWYHYWSRDTYEDMFQHDGNMHLADVNWPHIVTLCDEMKYPRCSWGYFLALMQPTSYNPHLLKKIYGEELEALSNKHFITPVIRGGCYRLRTIDQMSLIYIYTICHLYGEANETNADLKICPNPCKRRPCQHIQNAIRGSCKRRGYHKDDYECLCESGFEWEEDSLTCVLRDPCKSSCNHDTTEYCFPNQTTGVAVCICKTGYMGYDCNQPFNACISGTILKMNPLDAGSYIPSGYEACGVVLHSTNKCNPINDLLTYNCTCSTEYTKDLSLPYDNCLKRKDKCDAHICLHGDCISSKDFTNSVCDCDEGYTGEKCDIPVGIWSYWSEWTNCDHVCELTEHSTRVRICLSENEEDCVGELEQVVRSCGLNFTCGQNTSLSEIIWNNFTRWTENVMLYTLVYIGFLGVLLILLNLTKHYNTHSNGRL
ncbi:hypothetical protein MN116_001080 [Schistosoma mekongi]|uniref:EGF-like domain-containing protein n=1 Tax=Schistosoma mekongi TaxID=38744 RepID=A0AAE1ZLE7_SCHME|nr:hypothetical protein MN116_001080 [Schistosoma mekongi]